MEDDYPLIYVITDIIWHHLLVTNYKKITIEYICLFMAIIMKIYTSGIVVIG